MFIVALFTALSLSVLGTGLLGIFIQQTIPVKKPFQKLEFIEDGFTILQLTDFHEWAGQENGRGVTPEDSLKPRLTDFFDEVLENTKPDLVVVTGDNIFPLSFLWDFLGNISINTLVYIAEYFESKEQMWTMTFGNHDTESTVKKENFISAIASYKYFIGEQTEDSLNKSYTQVVSSPNESNRVGNYSIPIFKGEEIAFNLFLLDSGSHYSPGKEPRDYLAITQEQTNWYNEEMLRLKEIKGEVVPSILFTHIPFIEMDELYSSYTDTVYGLYGGISNSSVRSPIFHACVQNKDVRGIFFGHNHSSSLTLFSQTNNHKIMMGITPQCAADSYSDTTSIMYGRVIQLLSNGNFSTYIYSSSDYYTNNIFLDQTIFYTNLEI